ncbi:MAG: hypothetical protein WCI72_03495 [archaeon]
MKIEDKFIFGVLKGLFSHLFQPLAGQKSPIAVTQQDRYLTNSCGVW